MKVILDTYFRLGEKATYPKGTSFEGSLEELPEWVQDLVNEKNKDISVFPTPVVFEEAPEEVEDVSKPSEDVKEAEVPKGAEEVSEDVPEASEHEQEKKANLKPIEKSVPPEKPVLQKRGKKEGSK